MYNREQKRARTSRVNNKASSSSSLSAKRDNKVKGRIYFLSLCVVGENVFIVLWLC